MGTGLSPEKLLVVLFIALIVLGPDKLPDLARKVGKAWADLRRFREGLESEVKGAFGVSEITSTLSSPLSFFTDPPPTTAPAGGVPVEQIPAATAPVNPEAAMEGSGPGSAGPEGATDGSSAAGSADAWAATVTAGWDITGPGDHDTGDHDTGDHDTGDIGAGDSEMVENSTGAASGGTAVARVPGTGPGVGRAVVPGPWAGLGELPDDPSLN